MTRGLPPETQRAPVNAICARRTALVARGAGAARLTPHLDRGCPLQMVIGKNLEFTTKSSQIESVSTSIRRKPVRKDKCTDSL
jgi:hypothetical protein